MFETRVMLLPFALENNRCTTTRVTVKRSAPDRTGSVKKRRDIEFGNHLMRVHEITSRVNSIHADASLWTSRFHNFHITQNKHGRYLSERT